MKARPNRRESDLGGEQHDDGPEPDYEQIFHDRREQYRGDLAYDPTLNP